MGTTMTKGTTNSSSRESDESDESQPIIDWYSVYFLMLAVSIELVGISVTAFGIIELYAGGNPVQPKYLIPIGSVTLASGSLLFSKVYTGPKVEGTVRDLFGG